MSIDPATVLISTLLAVCAVAALTLLVAELAGTAAFQRLGARSARPPSGRTPGPLTRFDSWRGGLAHPSRASLARVLAGIVAAGVVWWFTGWPVAALAVAGLVAAWPAVSAGRRGEHRQLDVLDAVLTWTQGLRDTVAGGASLEQAIGVSVEGAPVALRPALEEVRSRMILRHPLDAALEPLQGVAGADFVVAALTLAARRRGDRLPDVLSGIVTTCAHEVAQRRQILAARAGIHRSVQIIMAVTLLILTWMATVGAAYMDAYDGAGGQAMLAVVIAVLAAGFTWLIRLDTTSSGPGFLAASDLTARQHRVVAALALTHDRTGPESGTAIWGTTGSDASSTNPGARQAASYEDDLGTPPSRRDQEREW